MDAAKHYSVLLRRKRNGDGRGVGGGGGKRERESDSQCSRPTLFIIYVCLFSSLPVTQICCVYSGRINILDLLDSRKRGLE